MASANSGKSYQPPDFFESLKEPVKQMTPEQINAQFILFNASLARKRAMAGA